MRSYSTHLILCLLVVMLGLSGAVASAQPVRVSLDPYQHVDWVKHHRHHGNFHTHTTQSDGKQTPAKVIDGYHALGYRILALTDHNKFTWPWSSFGRDPKKLGMIAVRGNELSRHHHTLSLFSDLTTDTRDLETAIKQVAKSGGLSVLAHPGRYWKLKDGQVPDEVRDKYVKLFKDNKTLIGFEVINKSNRYPHDRALWDAVLTHMMPDRPVWGMANDDSHSASQIGLNTTVMLLPSHDDKAVREALERGRFYFTTVASHPKNQRDRKGVPVIHAIHHDAAAATITTKATCKDKALEDSAFKWITAGGKMVHQGPKLELAKIKGLSRYVRAEIRGSGGTVYTQPFGLANADDPKAATNSTDGQGFRFVQLCDTQLGTGGYQKDVQRFEQAVRQINALKVDFVVVCGDLVNKADEKSFADFKAIKSKLKMPCHVVPGNHDVGNQPTPQSLATYRKLMGKDYFAFEHKSYLFACVNTSLWKAPVEGETDKHDVWLNQTLTTAVAKKKPVFIVGHYPLYRKKIDEPESYYNLPPARRAQLIKLFKESGVVAVVTGHTHKIVINEHQSMQLVTGQATSRTHGSPVGFRLWHVEGSPPFKHESIALETSEIR
jgi:histidinol phosphatase-like PHP family hydrolase/predicted MPP superfamily phosphohydrolase